jgi:hypothetical protein
MIFMAIASLSGLPRVRAPGVPEYYSTLPAPPPLFPRKNPAGPRRRAVFCLKLSFFLEDGKKRC